MIAFIWVEQLCWMECMKKSAVLHSKQLIDQYCTYSNFCRRIRYIMKDHPLNRWMGKWNIMIIRAINMILVKWMRPWESKWRGCLGEPTKGQSSIVLLNRYISPGIGMGNKKVALSFRSECRKTTKKCSRDRYFDWKLLVDFSRRAESDDRHATQKNVIENESEMEETFYDARVNGREEVTLEMVRTR
jgi:hypothetical protein